MEPGSNRLLLGYDHKRVVAEIVLTLRRVAALRDTPLRLIGLTLTPPFSLPSVKEDLQAFDLAVVFHHVAPEFRLFPRHEDQAASVAQCLRVIP
jgi:hypothetical protein